MSSTVLICDDAIFMRTIVGDILKRAGYVVVGEAATGRQAVEKYRELRPDFVTMDIVMPELSGIDAVREICSEDPAARVVMCSAMGQQALVVNAIQADARFVVKPFVAIGARCRPAGAVMTAPDPAAPGGARSATATWTSCAKWRTSARATRPRHSPP